MEGVRLRLRRRKCKRCGQSVPAQGTCRRKECAQGGLSVFSIDDFHRMLDLLRSEGMEREWFLISFLGKTGIKVGELWNLSPAHCIFDGPEMKIGVPTRGRNGYRIVWHRVSGEVAGMVEWWMKRESLGKHDHLFPYSPRSIRTMIRKAMERAGLANVHGTMIFRHFYGLTVARATESLEAVMKALRNKDARMARTYLKMASES